MKTTTQLEDEINSTHEIYRLNVGHKFLDGETLYRVISIRGSETLGYIASSEEWSTATGEHMPEFFEVNFQTSIYETAQAALNDAIPSAVKEAEAAGFTLDVNFLGGETVASPNFKSAVAAVAVVSSAPTSQRNEKFNKTTFAIGGLNTGDGAEAQTSYPKTGKICKKCTSSTSDGAMFTTIASGNICDDCI